MGIKQPHSAMRMKAMYDDHESGVLSDLEELLRQSKVAERNKLTSCLQQTKTKPRIIMIYPTRGCVQKQQLEPDMDERTGSK